MMLPSRFHAFRARMANHPASVFPRPCVREEWACAKSDVIFLMKGLKSMKRVYVACSRLLHRHALPIDYILGWTPFCGQRVRVQRPLLIPRRDTEQWLHIAIEKYFCGVETVLEVGTGTGCIAMALANQIPNLKLITAVDVDRRAINVASKNCLKYPNVEVIQADIFQNSPILSDRKYDLVISNPPYIRRQLCSRMVAPSVSKWESHQALFAERDVFYKRIINLQTAPILALEIDGSRSTCRRIIRYASEYYSRHRVIRDGANLPHSRGKIILSRDYRGDIAAEASEKLVPHLEELEERGQLIRPVVYIDGIVYLHVRHADIYVVALTRHDTGVMGTILFLHRLVAVFGEYFGRLAEESLRDNFVVVYELLDEMVDFGRVQTTETRVLQQYITQRSFQIDPNVPAKLPVALTGAVSWRAEGIKYRKNEAFLDVIEAYNVLVSVSGNVIQSEIFGVIKARCYLTGMPELRLGLNERVVLNGVSISGQSNGISNISSARRGALDSGSNTMGSVELEDVKFHQCVRLDKFDSERTISFIPPDGEFDLMSYRVVPPPAAKPPFMVECAIECWNDSRIEYVVCVQNLLKKRTSAINVEIFIPVPEYADSPRLRAHIGSVAYEPEKAAVKWSIGFFPAGKEFKMRARFGFPSVRSSDSASGMQVRYLKIVERSGYSALPWVRYVTKQGDFLTRMPEEADPSAASVLAAR